MAAPVRAQDAIAPHRVVVRLREPAVATLPSFAPFGVRDATPLFPTPRHTTHARGALPRFLRLTLDPARDPRIVAAALRELPEVASAETVPLWRTSAVPNDPSFPVQWHLQRGDGHDARLPAAWDRTQGDTSVVLAIADTGVDWLHPDLTSQIALNAAEANGVPGVDDDGNGYVDDIRGWDFVTADPASVASGEDPGPPDNDPRDWVGHGTLVAGTTAAATDNAVGVAGVAWRCTLLPIRIGYGVTGVDGGYIAADDAAAGLAYAADRGVAAINCSWDSSPTDAFTAAVDYAIAAGVVIVDAAGNHATSSFNSNYLAQRGDCIDVAATDTLDLLANFSSYGTWVDCAAPGTRVLTTSYAALQDTHGYETASGTSLSAPVVTGIVGLLRARFPSWPPKLLRERLLATCEPIDALNASTYGGKLGRGRVDAAAAVGSETTYWQAALSGGARTAVGLGDFGVGARGLVLVATDGGAVHALRAGGGEVAGWPVSVGASPGPVASGTLGGAPVVVAGGLDSLLHAFDSSGAERSGWPAHLGAALRGGASIGQAGSPPVDVVTCGTEGRRVYVLDANGAVLAGWPQSTGGVVRASPALADLDGDGANEIVIAAADSTAYAWRIDGSAVPGWPVRVPAGCLSPVAVGPVTDGGAQRVVVACSNGAVTLLGADGVAQAGWPVQVAASSSAPPALADVDGDGQRDVVCAAGSTLTVLTAAGVPLAGWPLAAPGSIGAAPVVADLDGDGAPDILAATTTNAILGYDAHGAAVAGFPRYAGGAVRGAPLVADLGGDGDANLVTAAADSFAEAMTLPGTARTSAAAPWACASHDPGRTGWVGTSAASAVGPPGESPDEDAAPGLRVRIVTGGTAAPHRLLAEVRTARDATVRMSHFDVAGRRLSTRSVLVRAASPRRIDLGAGARLPSGVVLVTAQAGTAPPTVSRAVLVR